MKGYGAGIDTIILTRTPLLWGLAEELILDQVCGWTGHRFCNSWWANWLRTGVERHTAEFWVPADGDTRAQFAKWMGWEQWEWPEVDDATLTLVPVEPGDDEPGVENGHSYE